MHECLFSESEIVYNVFFYIYSITNNVLILNMHQEHIKNYAELATFIYFLILFLM